MQPWEREKQQPRIGLRKKMKHVAAGLSFGVLCCGVIYTSLLYSATKHVFLRRNQRASA